MDEETKKYHEAQFGRIVKSDIYSPHIKIRDGKDGETNWMSITNDQLNKIKAILT